jgi:predicted transposase YdaD
VHTGLNKGFDRVLKSFAEESPKLFLHVLGFLPADSKATIQPLRTETAPSVVLPDYVAAVRIEAGEQEILHAEFESSYRADVPGRMARYGGSLAWQYQLPVRSALVMLREDRTPRDIPELGCCRIGATETFHPYKVVRLWEIDPTAVLETKDTKLLAWALLMKSSVAQAFEIGATLQRTGDEDSIGAFLTLGGVRYDRRLLEEMLGGAKVGLVRAILDGSKLVEEVREEARAQGEIRGEVRGKMDGERRFLRLLLRKRLPELESLPEIDTIASIERLESLGELVMDAADAGAVRGAIVSAAKLS